MIWVNFWNSFRFQENLTFAPFWKLQTFWGEDALMWSTAVLTVVLPWLFLDQKNFECRGRCLWQAAFSDQIWKEKSQKSHLVHITNSRKYAPVFEKWLSNQRWLFRGKSHPTINPNTGNVGLFVILPSRFYGTKKFLIPGIWELRSQKIPSQNHLWLSNRVFSEWVQNFAKNIRIS